MRSIACVMLLGFAFGCGGAPDCKTAVEKALASTHKADMKFAGKVIERCEKDGWSGEVRTCLSNVKSDSEAEACLAKVESLNTELGARKDAEEARLRQAVAEQQAALAVAEAKEATAKLEAVKKQLDELDAKVSAAVDAIASAESEADRAAAKAKLDQLRREKADIEANVAAAKASAARAERVKGVQISKECLDNPLAKGCN